MRSKTVWLLALLTLLAPACADDKHLAPIVLPVASQGMEDKDDDPAPRVIVGLLATGEMRLAGKLVGLESLSAILKKRREKHKEDLKAPSKFFVMIRADRDVAWKRVLWVMTVCAENYIYKLQLGVKLTAGDEAKSTLEGKLSVPLTWPVGRNVLRYELDIDHTCDGETVYRFPERKTTDPKAVRAWAAEAWKAVRDVRGVAVVARVRADANTPLRYVVAAISTLREAGWKEIDYFVTSIPKADLKPLKFFPWK